MQFYENDEKRHSIYLIGSKNEIPKIDWVILTPPRVYILSPNDDNDKRLLV